MTQVLVTSGCSYLGQHVVEALRGQGYSVLVQDSAPPASYVPPSGTTLVSRDQPLMEALHGVEVVVHLLEEDRAPTTPALLDAMAASGTARLVLESTLEVYGEGLYADGKGRLLVPERPAEDLATGRWPITDDSGQPLTPMPTPETTTPAPVSPRGKAALLRESQAQVWAEAEGRHICILRLAAMFGPPATQGILPNDDIWRMMAEIEDGRPPQIAEDGEQIRDWLHVRDAARALQMAVAHCDRGKGAINISTGRGYTARQIAQFIASAAFRYDLEPHATGRPDPHVARHLIGTPHLAQTCLKFTADLPLENALGELVMCMRQHLSRPSQTPAELTGLQV